MTKRAWVTLSDRGVLEIAGDDRHEFLQGLVSNDVKKVSTERAIYAALLTAQGKYLHDFFITEIAGKFYIDAEAARLSDLKRRLALYKLRAKVTIEDVSNRYSVSVAFGDGTLEALGLAGDCGRAMAFEGGTAFVDPRLADLGARFIMPRDIAAAAFTNRGFMAGDTTTYDRLRLSLGVPDGSRDLPIEKAILLEAGFDELNGIDWQKGCYVGQELTARTKYRALIKRRLMPVIVDGPLPLPGTPILIDDQEAGEMRSGQGGIGIALLRLDSVSDSSKEIPLKAGDAQLTPRKPAWVKF